MLNMKGIAEMQSVWKETIVDYFPKVILALGTIVLFYFIAKIFKRLSLQFYVKVFKKQLDLAKFISVVIYFFFLLFGVFFSLEILGLEQVLTKMLAGAGIVGIIAGFAFKDIASNAFAGLLLNLQRPFKIGDLVTINDNFGIVFDIDWITTSIKTNSGQEVFIPNQLIYSTTFTNFSTFNKRRVSLESGISYGDDLEQVKVVTLEEVKKINLVLNSEPIDFYFTSIGNSAYNFEVRFWINFTKQTDYLEAMSQVIIAIKKRFEQENISIAYSVTTLDFGVKGGVNLFDKSISINPIKN